MIMLNEVELNKVAGGCQVNYDQNGNPYITPAHMDCAKPGVTIPHGKTMVKAEKIDLYPPLGH